MYVIIVVQYVLEKEVIVDNGVYFDGEQSGMVNGVMLLVVQYLIVEVIVDSGEYQVLV